MKFNKRISAIQSRFTELLNTTNYTTSNIIKIVALQFRATEAEVTDAITKAPAQRKGARK